MRVRASSSVVCMALSGCATSPSISVLGAYFPSWMFCIVGAIVASSIVRVTLRKMGGMEGLNAGGRLLAYCALTVVFALVGWIIFFKN